MFVHNTHCAPDKTPPHLQCHARVNFDSLRRNQKHAQESQRPSRTQSLLIFVIFAVSYVAQVMQASFDSIAVADAPCP